MCLFVCGSAHHAERQDAIQESKSDAEECDETPGPSLLPAAISHENPAIPSSTSISPSGAARNDSDVPVQKHRMPCMYALIKYILLLFVVIDMYVSMYCLYVHLCMYLNI